MSAANDPTTRGDVTGTAFTGPLYIYPPEGETYNSLPNSVSVGPTTEDTVNSLVQVVNSILQRLKSLD